MMPAPELCAARLLDVARAMASEPDLPRLLGRILEAVLELTGAQRGFISTGDATYAVPDEAPRPSRTVLARAWSAARPFVVADALADRDVAASESVQGQRIRSLCAVPLRDGRETVGVLLLDHTERPGLFTGEHLEALSGVAALAVVALRSARLATELARRLRRQERELDRLRGNRSGIIARSRAMRAVLEQVDRAAGVPYPVHLHGESGTGKELIARAIHAGRGPFIPANCAAIPESLAESELFGHMKGAFTGADHDRPGLFEEADRGVLFLDEVEAMPGPLQEKLLRVLQDGVVRRVGARQGKKVTVRIVSASNQDLAGLVARGRFRTDLFYRLSGIRIELPPLRERPEDIAPLAEHFLDRFAAETGRPRPSLSPAALHALTAHAWPGNVRELQNAIWQAATMSQRGQLSAEDLAFLRAAPVPGPADGILSLEEYIRRVVIAHEGKLPFAEIARRLGVSRKTLWDRRKRWGA